MSSTVQISYIGFLRINFLAHAVSHVRQHRLIVQVWVYKHQTKKQKKTCGTKLRKRCKLKRKRQYLGHNERNSLDQPISKQHVNFNLVIYPLQHNEYL